MNDQKKMAAPLITLLAISIFSGCTTEQTLITTTANDQALHEQMAIDSRYMKDLLRKAGGPSDKVAIDLADENQYRFVVNRLAAAGKTTSNAPDLFERLQKSRDNALSPAAVGSRAIIVPPTDWCANRVQLGAERKVGNTITYPNTHVNVSCVNGASYVYADITTFNANTSGTEAIVVGSAAGEDYSGGTHFDEVSINPALPAVVGRVNETDSLLMAYNDLGHEQMTYNLVKTNVVPTPSTVTLVHPVFHNWLSNGGYIQMCQLRGSPNQCDYAVGSLAAGLFKGWIPNSSGFYTGIAAVKAGTGTGTIPWAGDTANYFSLPTNYVPNDLTRVYVPLQGTIDAGATATNSCIIKTVDIAEFRLRKDHEGGMCTTSTSFKAAIPTGARTATFRTIGVFNNNGGTDPTSGPCGLDALIRNEYVQPSLTIKVMADCGTGTWIPRFATMSPGNNDPLPQRMYFMNSCFAEGTRIRRADGTAANVEEVKVGDKVIANDKGTILTVTGTSHGGEAEPLVILRDSKDHELRLTATHPVVKASGEVVVASAVQKGDLVTTDRGVASIVSATRAPYDGQVYNLSLGTAEERAQVGEKGTTMFAGGILVGDSSMQQHINSARRSAAKPSEEWSRDYANAMANKPPMTRTVR